MADRVYLEFGDLLLCEGGEPRFAIVQKGFGNTVVWRPSIVMAGALDDLHSGAEQECVCIEATHIYTGQGRRPLLPARSSWTGVQFLRLPD